MRIPLSSAADWELVDRDQDVRGWRVESSSGEQLGQVTDLLIDTELEHIDELILDSGTRIYPEDVTLGDGVVMLLPDARVRPGAGGTRAMGVSRVGEQPDTDANGTGPGEASPEYEVHPEPEPLAILEASSTDGPEVAPPAPLTDPLFADALEPPPPIDLATMQLPPPMADESRHADAVARRIGAIEVETRVIEERHNVEVPVSRDRVVVRRLIVDRPAEGNEEPYWEGDEYHIPVLAERIEIRRVLRVVEELVVTRGQIQDAEHIDESVRREAITVRERHDEPVARQDTR